MSKFDEQIIVVSRELLFNNEKMHLMDSYRKTMVKVKKYLIRLKIMK